MKCTISNKTTKIKKLKKNKKDMKIKTTFLIKWEMLNRQDKEEAQETCLPLCLPKRWQYMRSKTTELSKRNNMKKIKLNFKMFRRNNRNNYIRNVNLTIRLGFSQISCRVRWASSSISSWYPIRTSLNKILDFSIKVESYGTVKTNSKTI